MILIRGINGESYARKIEKGIIDCRDLLSALLKPPVTGYEYSDYYEKNMVKALAHFSENKPNLQDWKFLYSLLIDYYIPHIYLTYFHVLNRNSLEWLDKFDGNYKFIAVNIKLDKNTNTAIGNEYFGTRMKYVNSICDIRQEDCVNFYAACMCSIENLFSNKLDMACILKIYNTIFFPLLCREKDDKFTDIENEFRIIAYDCPRIEDGAMKQLPRETTIIQKSGAHYLGTLVAGNDTIFTSNLSVLRNPIKPLSEILMEGGGGISLESKFKSINIGTISDSCTYIGDKQNCVAFIKKELFHPSPDVYTNRTVRKKYSKKNLKDATFMPGYQKIDYEKL